MSVIRLDNVSYTYRGAETPAVNSVSCEFEAGQMYAIIGPSGSGKSTLLSMLAGLVVIYAAAHLLSCAVGTEAAAVSVTRRNVLELLQVKE